MINIYEVNETNHMIQHENLDVRTITLGISLLDCAAEDVDTFNEEEDIKDMVVKSAEFYMLGDATSIDE